MSMGIWNGLPKTISNRDRFCHISGNLSEEWKQSIVLEKMIKKI